MNDYHSLNMNNDYFNTYYDIDLNDTEQKIYRRHKLKMKEEYDFKPIISYLSRTLAEKKGDSAARIYSTHRENNRVDKNIGKVKYFLCEDDSEKKTKSKSALRYSNSNSNYLYDQAEIMRKRKENRIKKEQLAEENSLKDTLTFRPVISKLPANHISKELFSSSSKESFFKKQHQWIKGRGCHKIKEYYVSLEQENCTFRPKISQSSIPDDERFIQKRLDQITSYVIRRQNVLCKNKEQKLYADKKFFNEAKKFVIKPTVCREFTFETDKLKEKRDKYEEVIGSQSFRPLMSYKHKLDENLFSENQKIDI